MHCDFDDIKMNRQQTGRLQAKLLSAKNDRFWSYGGPTFAYFLQQIKGISSRVKFILKSVFGSGRLWGLGLKAGLDKS